MLLYERKTSGHAYKIRLLLSILKIPYESVWISAKHGRNVVDDAYRQLNPRGQIPTLCDGDITLWGSTSILFYLASRYDRERLWLPEDVVASSHVMQWLDFAQTDIHGLFLDRAITHFGYAGDLRAARQLGRRALDILDDWLGRHDWLVGGSPTIADIACFPYVAVADRAEFQLASRQGVMKWLERIARIDGYVSMPGMEGSAESEE